MKKVVALFLFALPLAAQTSDDITFRNTFLLRNVTGTTANPGVTPHHPHLSQRGEWTYFHEGALFLSYSSESGPAAQRTEAFSTNWLAGGAQRSFGSRGLLLLRGRASLEPLTIKEEGSPQLLQFVSPVAGGLMIDRMRAHDLIGELAAHGALRVGNASFFHLYAAPVGVPALGALPYAQRASSEEFAEAPLSYDVQESFHRGTRVVTAGFASRWLAIEASTFHHSITFDRHTDFGDGSIDSQSARLTLTPGRNVSIQISRGELGEEDLEISSGSIAYSNNIVSTGLIFTRREPQGGEAFDALTAEATIRARRNTFLARIESVDRPDGVFGDPLDDTVTDQTTHFTLGYMFDFLRWSGYRVGAGFNFDYHTQTHDIEDIYGHKPQSIFVFARVRTESLRR